MAEPVEVTPTTSSSESVFFEGDLPTPRRNDFSLDSGFDSDLEDGVLATSPVACSTPCKRRSLISHSMSFDSQHCSPSMSLSRGTESTRTSISKLDIHTRYRRIPSSPVLDKSTVLLQSNIAQASMGHRLSPTVVAVPCKRAKKHPSPSKETLEDLEIAFHKVSWLKVANSKATDPDELGANHDQPSASLRRRDPNRRVLKSQPNGLGSSSTSISNGVATKISSKMDTSPLVPMRPLNTNLANATVSGKIKVRRPPIAELDELDELH